MSAIVPDLALRFTILWPMLPAADTSLTLPWLLFGSGVAIDGETRWVLAMSLVAWFVARQPAEKIG